MLGAPITNSYHFNVVPRRSTNLVSYYTSTSNSEHGTTMAIATTTTSTHTEASHACTKYEPILFFNQV